MQLGLLYATSLLNGLNRRALGCSSPLLEEDGQFTMTELDDMSFNGYRAFAFGRACAGPLVIKVGSKNALLLQLVVMGICQCTMALGSALPRSVRAVAWMIVRAMSAMSISIMVPMVRSWVPRKFYARTWALLQSGVQTGGRAGEQSGPQRVAGRLVLLKIVVESWCTTCRASLAVPRVALDPAWPAGARAIKLDGASSRGRALQEDVP